MIVEDSRMAEEEKIDIIEYYPFLEESIPKQDSKDTGEKQKSEKDSEETIDPPDDSVEQSSQEEVQPETDSKPQNEDNQQAQNDHKNTNHEKTDLYTKEELARREKEKKKFSSPKEQETVFTYNYLKEKTKELGIKDKIALYGLMKNINQVSIIHINGMVKGGLTEDEIDRIQHILERELDQKEFEKAKEILDKYINIE